MGGAVSSSEYRVSSRRIGSPLAWGVLITAIVPLIFSAPSPGHFFIFEYDKVGSVPPEPGVGWIGECFFIPEANAGSLLSAESYVIGRAAAITFRTPYIDFPSGPLDVDQDANFATIGDFLDDYIYELSAPEQLDAPFGHFLLRFTGYAAATLEYSTWDEIGLPVRIDFGTWGFDGYRTRMGSTSIYRVQNTAPLEGNGWYSCDGLPLALGLYPVTITYFNRYDPTGASGNETAGVELYSWYPGGLAWPTGNILVHHRLGPMTILPPEVIYQRDQVVAPLKGDFEADFDIDLRDFQWLQVCYTGPDNFDLGLGCQAHDFDFDGDLDGDDLAPFVDRLDHPGGGPEGNPLHFGDFDEDLDLDFQDMAAFQACHTGEGAAHAPLTPPCAFRFDADEDADVDAADFDLLLPVVTGPRGRLFGGE